MRPAAVGVVPDEHGDGVQGIEEEVRLELRLQRAELGPRQLGLQPVDGDLPLAQLAVKYSCT